MNDNAAGRISGAVAEDLDTPAGDMSEHLAFNQETVAEWTSRSNTT